MGTRTSTIRIAAVIVKVLRKFNIRAHAIFYLKPFSGVIAKRAFLKFIGKLFAMYGSSRSL
jgi:hypothetical protein